MTAVPVVTRWDEEGPEPRHNMGRGDASGGRRDRRARRAAATAVVAATGFGFGLAALGVGAAAFAVGEIRTRASGAGSSRSKRPPLGEREWRAAADRDGRVGDRLDAVLRRVSSGGVDPALRAEVWPLLLGLREPWHTAVEQEQRRRARRDAYRALRARCDELERLLAGKGGTAAAAAPRPAANKTSGEPPPPKPSRIPPKTSARTPRLPPSSAPTSLEPRSGAAPSLRTGEPSAPPSPSSTSTTDPKPKPPPPIVPRGNPRRRSDSPRRCPRTRCTTPRLATARG